MKILFKALVFQLFTSIPWNNHVFPCSAIGEGVIYRKSDDSFDLAIEQITFGPRHHFFGYIGQCQTIPWNSTGRYILGLEIGRIDQMPQSQDGATIFVIDTRDINRIIPVDTTHAWNPQQGTMFYWNPLKPESQFFFNDRDRKTGRVFTVLYDLDSNKRVREYRFDDTPIGNGGVAADGSAWLGINYGRLARLRPVTGYPGTLDWSKDEIAPKNDGIFKIDIKSGERTLLVSYYQLDQMLRNRNPDLTHDGLFINHTLWNRDSNRIYFFARAGWNGQGGERINVPFTVNSDGSGLTMHEIHIGGHPEWGKGNIMIGSERHENRSNDRQILYDTGKKLVIGQLGNADIFPNPEGDIALSPDGNWFVNGYSQSQKNYYSVYRIHDGAYKRSEGIGKGTYGGDIRIDPAPRWNRTNDAILVPGIAEDGTRQMFVIRIIMRQ